MNTTLRDKEAVVIGYDSKVLQSDCRLLFHGTLCFVLTVCLTGTLLIVLPKFNVEVKSSWHKVKSAWNDRKHYKKMYKITLDHYRGGTPPPTRGKSALNTFPSDKLDIKNQLKSAGDLIETTPIHVK